MLYSRINFNFASGSYGSINSLKAANRTLNESYTRIRTGYRINDAKDDPSGLVDSINLSRDIDAHEVTIRGNQESFLEFGKIDSAQQVIADQLVQIRNEVQGIINESDPMVRQAALDTVISYLEAIDTHANAAKIGGSPALDGNRKVSLGASATSLLNITDTHVRKYAKDTTLFMQFDNANTAEQAYTRNNYTTPTAGNDAVIRLTTDEGSKTIQITAGTNITDAAAAIDLALDDLGGEASVNGGDIIVNTVEYGDDKSIRVDTVSGDNIFGAATVQDAAGVTGTVNINGTNYNLDGDLEVHYSDGSLSASFQFDPTLVGVNTATDANPASANINMTPTGGLFVQFGTDPSSKLDSAFVGLQSLQYADLGLDAIITNGNADYMLTNEQGALDLIDEAISHVSESLTHTGTFMKHNLESMTDYLRSLSEDIFEQRSLITDTDQAEEMVRAAKAEMMQQAGISALASQISSHQNLMSVLDIMS
ncbi:MAG: flagellin [Planctomycetota bacterium]|jgi:flagellin